MSSVGIVRRFVPVVMLLCVLLVVCMVLSLSRKLNNALDYRGEVQTLAVDFYTYMTNLEFRINQLSTRSIDSAPTNILNTADVQQSIGVLPYTYSVVSGVPGLCVSSKYFYPVGSVMAYGVLTLCGPDFAIFDDSFRYVLRKGSDDRCAVF